MIIQHPLAAKELGSFVDHIVFNAAKDGEAADWQVDYMYEHGMVTMSVRQNNYKYETILNKRVDVFIKDNGDMPWADPEKNPVSFEE